MSTIDVRFHLFGTQERIVDERIDSIRMMDIDDIGTSLLYTIQELIVMMIAFAPLFIRINRTERSQRQVEIIIQPVSFFHAALTGISINTCSIGSIMNIDTSISGITPGYRHVQRFLMIEIGIQRTFVFIIIQADLDTGIDITHPNSILVFLYIPFPAKIIRTITAFLSQTHHITSDTGC